MILIILGAPGAGKGTQSKLLCQKYDFTHLATGDVFRAEIAAKSNLGIKAQEYVKSGRLVPDELVVEMVAAKLELSGNKYLLDGFPRNLAQAQALSEQLNKQGGAISAVVYLNLPAKEAIARLTSRRVCGKCGEVFNTMTRPPKQEGLCDACGGELVQREDDSEATAKKRLMVFDDLTHPLVAYYKAEQVFHEIDAAQSPEAVAKALASVVDAAAPAR